MEWGENSAQSVMIVATEVLADSYKENVLGAKLYPSLAKPLLERTAIFCLRRKA
jgi:hypothetical protein